MARYGDKNDALSGAEYLASIYGTEKDKVNCSFYFKASIFLDFLIFFRLELVDMAINVREHTINQHSLIL